jgi:hypothetical protein
VRNAPAQAERRRLKRRTPVLLAEKAGAEVGYCRVKRNIHPELIVHKITIIRGIASRHLRRKIVLCHYTPVDVYHNVRFNSKSLQFFTSGI